MERFMPLLPYLIADIMIFAYCRRFYKYRKLCNTVLELTGALEKVSKLHYGEETYRAFLRQNNIPELLDKDGNPTWNS